MADNNADGVTVVVTADTSGLASATNQVNTFGSTLKATMAQTATAMGTTAAATSNLNNTTSNLGDTIGKVGSRREMSESLRLIQAGAEGTNGAVDALRVTLLTFASSMGGPYLIAVAAAVAVLGTLIELITSANEQQKQLNETAAALNLPVSDVKNMSAAALDLATQIASANAGLSKLGSAQVNILKSMGLDPTDTTAATKALATIANSSEDAQTKLQQIGAVFGLTGDKAIQQAQSKLDDYLKTSEEHVNSWWQRLGAALAVNEGDISQDDLNDFNKTKGDAAKQQNTGHTPTSNTVTQQQLDAAQALQDSLLSILNKGSSARISAYTNEADKIIAEAQQETAALLQEAAKQAAAQPGGASGAAGQSIMAAANSSAASITAAAQQKAQQARIAAQQQFNAKLQALYDADAQAQISAQTDATQKLTDQANIEVNEKAQALAKDLTDTQLTTAQKQALEDAYVQYVIDREQQLANDIDQLNTQKLAKQNAYYTNVNKAFETLSQQGSNALKDIGETTEQQLADQLQDRLTKAADLYQQDVDNAKKALDQKLIDQQTYGAQVLQYAQDYNTSVAKIYQANTLDQYKQTNTQLTNWGDMSKQMDQFWSTTMNDSATQLANFVATGKFSFSSFTQSILTDLAKIGLEKAIAGIFGPLFNGGGGSGSGSPMEVQSSGVDMDIGGGMAGGGTVQAGVAIPVNERGQEMFIPNVGGTVVNNAGSTASGGGSITVNIQNNGTAQKVQSATPTQTLDQMVIDIITTDVARGGKTAQTLGSAFNLKRGG